MFCTVKWGIFIIKVQATITWPNYKTNRSFFPLNPNEGMFPPPPDDDIYDGIEEEDADDG